MRTIAVIAMIFFLPVVVIADCASSGIWPLTQSSVLNRNGVIILEFYGGSQEVVPGLGKEHPIYLESEKEKVALSVIETFVGEKYLTQVVLKPVSVLAENEIYALVIDGITRLGRYNSITQKYVPFTYKINNVIDNDAPTFNADPFEQKKTFVYAGCGPVSWVYFTINGMDKSELFVKAKVRSETSGKTSVYILAIENGITKVGHGMCSGAFNFSDGDNFDVAFQLFDQSGNESNWGKSIFFTKPSVITVDK